MNEAPYHTELTRGAILDGAYRIVRLIAQGGMGHIYEAEQLRLARRVALKVLSVDPKKSGEFLPRFRREAEICAKLQHPNIVAVLDWNVAHGMPYMVMEYLEGEDLGARLSRGLLSLEETLRVVQDIATGLTAAHAHGVVHRDLKPSNVFLCNVGSEHPHVKLLDFGVSKVAWETTLSTTSPKVLGSPRYMAPEQARGDTTIDARVDQFALGTVLYEMLSGKFAFDGDTLTTVLYRVVHEPPTPLASLAPHLPAHVVASVERAMAKAPRNRFQDVAQLVAALRGEVAPNVAHRVEAVTGETEALGAGTRRARRGWMPPPRALASAAVAGGLLLLAGWRLVPILSEEHTLPSTEDRSPTTQDRSLMTENRLPTAEDRQPTTDDRIPTTEDRQPTAENRQPTTEPRLPPPETDEIKRLLDDAQQRFDDGDFQEAIRRSRQALGLGESPRARLLIAVAYCNLGSVGDARAALFRVRGEDKQTVQRACQAHGLDLR